MDHRRPPFRIYIGCLISLLTLFGVATIAGTFDKETQQMTQFASRTSQLNDALKSSQYMQSTLLNRPMAFDRDAFVRVFGDDIKITSFHSLPDGPDLSVNVFAVKNDALAMSLDITQITGHDRMVQAIAGSFDTISAPLDGLEVLPKSGNDLMLRLSAMDTYAVAARGDILVQVSTGKGFGASVIAGQILNEIFMNK